MGNIYYTCPFCHKTFKDIYPASRLICPHCNNTLSIFRLTNGKQECGIVGTTLVYYWGATGIIEFPADITFIENSVFQNCPKLTEVILSNTKVEEIGEKAFFYCFRLQFIELPESLKIIRKEAFRFTGIQKLFIPKNVELIEEGAFDSCPLIKEITVHKDNPFFVVKNGKLIDKRTNQIIATCCKHEIIYKITISAFEGKQKPKEMYFRGFDEYNDKRVEKALNAILTDDNRFIVCDADKPVNNITFIQAVSYEDKMHIEFHLQKSDNDKTLEIWSCLCDIAKCKQYFCSFLRGEFIPNFNEWKLEKSN